MTKAGAVALALLGAAPAHATFPGANGRLLVGGGSGAATIEPDGSDRRPAPAAGTWSADGKRLAFIRREEAADGDDLTHVAVVEADGTGQRDLTTSKDGVSSNDDLDVEDFGPVAWSPDGTQIAFSRRQFMGTGEPGGSYLNTGVWVVNSSGGGERELTSDADLASAFGPAWSPDGTRIAFILQRRTADGSLQPAIFVMNADGSGQRQVTAFTDKRPTCECHESLGVPNWSPDGTRLAFSTERGIDVVNTDGTGRTTLVSGAFGPVWSPDGRKIAFNRSSPSVIVIRDLADATEREITGQGFVLDWQPLPLNAVAITSAPPEVGNRNAATFEFVFVGGTRPPGRFQCSLDGGGFADCTSPATFTGLPDGERRFQVRYVPDLGALGEPTERRFEVDTTPPAVVFDVVPSGAGNAPDATVTFHSTEPAGATFRCSLDGGPAEECTSPHRLSGLTDGSHSLAVTTLDRAGNESAIATVAWTVGTPPQSVACPGGPGEVTLGPVRLVPRSTDGCFVAAVVGGRQVRVATGEVALNGIRLLPRPGTRIIVEERLGDGRVQSDGPLDVGFGALAPVPLPRLDIDGIVTSSRFLSKRIDFAAGVLSAAEVPIVPAVQFEFTEENGGSTKATFRVEFPKAAFTAAPGSAEGITLEGSPTFSNDRGVTGAFRVKAGQVFLFGKYKIKDLDLALDFATDTFEGSGGLALAPPQAGLAQTTLTLGIGIGSPIPVCTVVRRLSLKASNLQKDIGDGVRLQRAGGEFACGSGSGGAVWTLTANGGASFGPRIQVGSFEGEAASVDGTATFTLPLGTGSQSLEIAGTGKVVELPFSRFSMKYTAPLHFEQSATLDTTISGIGVRLDQRNFYLGLNGYSIGLAGRVNLFGADLAGEGVVSTKGFAICAGPSGEQIGFGKVWGREPRQLGGACDLGEFAVTASAASAAGPIPQRFTVRPATRLQVVAVPGAGAPPKIALVAPDGERFETPAGGGPLEHEGLLLYQDTERDTTVAVLRRPAAGLWKVTRLPRSVPVRGLRIARGLSRIRLSAGVTGSGSRRILRWTAAGLRGQRVEFAERGRSGGARVLTTTSRPQGRLRFAPDPALGRARSIVAIVYRNGLPRKAMTVARFQTAPPRRAGRARDVAVRRGVLRWRPAPGAVRYELGVTRPDGTATSHSTRRPRLKLRDLPAGAAVRVEIVALDALGRPGPRVRARLVR